MLGKFHFNFLNCLTLKTDIQCWGILVTFRNNVLSRKPLSLQSNEILWCALELLNYELMMLGSIFRK